MTALAWDQTGERLFETGVDRGVLYIPDQSGDYVEGFKPTSQIVVDSTQVDSADLDILEGILYGGPGDDARLPLPDEIVAIFGGTGVTDVNLRTAANGPTFNESSGVLNLPNVTGVQWQVDGTDQAPGAQPAIASGDSITVTAEAQSGYNLVGDNEWTFQRT
jgi:hypothetical protein